MQLMYLNVFKLIINIFNKKYNLFIKFIFFNFQIYFSKINVLSQLTYKIIFSFEIFFMKIKLFIDLKLT